MFEPTELQGFGSSSPQELLELRKALEIDDSRPPVGPFDPLRVESLDASLKIVTYNNRNIVLWNDIPKKSARSRVEEYNKLVSYGPERGGFVPSGVLPEEEDSVYAREFQRVKYVGTTRSVHHTATLMNTMPSDLIATETQNGILWMLRRIERALFYGDEAALPLEWNGLTSQIVSGGGNIIDLRGGQLTNEVIENGADIVHQNFGLATAMYSNSRVFVDFAKIHFQFQRFAAPNTPTGMVGTPINGVETQIGPIAFRPDVFVTKGKPAPNSANSPLAPNAPTVAPAVNGAPQAGSQWEAADAGAYAWRVTALNKYGESAATALTASTAVAAGESVSLTITDGGGATAATAYKIYRTEKDDATGVANEIVLALIPRAQDAAGNYLPSTVHVDLNADLPLTYVALMLDMSNQSMAFHQLSPLIRMPLAQISPAFRWMQFLYGTPIVYDPKKNVVFKNIAEATL